MLIRTYKFVVGNKGFWINVLVLMYPFLLLAGLGYTSAVESRSLYDFFKSTVFNFILFCSGLLLLVALSPPGIKWILLRAVYLLESLLVFVSIYHFCLYGQLIGLPAVYAMVETNFGESLEYAGTYFRASYLSLALIAAAPLLWFAIRPAALPSIQEKKPFILIMSAAFFSLISLAAFSNWRPYLTEYNPLVSISKNLNIALKEKSRLEKLYSALPVIDTKPVLLNRRKNKVTHVLVISEAINRSHMSLYGYARKTNPHLERMANELYVLKDACSSQNTTIPALKDMLTFATPEHPERLYKAPNLIQIMQAAGFETYWLSNQQEVGIYDSMAAIFSRSAKHKLFINRRGWEEVGASLDEGLIAPFQDALKEKPAKKFIVIHLIGAHVSYAWRYPQHFDVFNNLDDVPDRMKRFIETPYGEKTFNQYDNAILYNDYVVSRLLNSLDKNEEVTFTYISDHGEAVGEKGEFFGHAENMQYRAINEIPVFFWLSESSRAHLREKVSNLTANLALPFLADQSIHTLLDLYEVYYPLVNFEHSLFSMQFSPKKRGCDSLKK